MWQTISETAHVQHVRPLCIYKVAVRPLSVTSPCTRKASACCVNTEMTSLIVGRASGALLTHRIMSSRSTPFVTRPICSWICCGTGSSLMHISHNSKPKLYTSAWQKGTKKCFEAEESKMCDNAGMKIIICRGRGTGKEQWQEHSSTHKVDRFRIPDSASWVG